MLNIYKPQGLTPKEVLDLLRSKRSDLIDETLSYAGRLDPLASGVLPVLVGRAENQAREKYLSLNKKYQARFIFGFSTDTGDIMGLLQEKDFTFSRFSFSKVQELINNLPGRREQTAPRYSSPALAGANLKSRERIIYTATLQDKGFIKGGEIKNTATEIINKVTGDFRQKEILKDLENIPDELDFPWIVMELECSSGFYLRVLVEDFAPAIVWPIKRLRVGDMDIKDALKLY